MASRLLFGGSAPGGFAEHRFQLFDKVVHVLEFAIDRREADEGDLVDIPQDVEDSLADVAGGDFAIEVAGDVRFDFADNLFDLLVADRPLIACLFESAANPFAVERDSRAIFLDDAERRFFDLLVSGEAAAAGLIQTFPASANGELFAGARIDHLRLRMPAERAHHGQSLARYSTSPLRMGADGWATRVH